ncbi:hypothetical protein GCM10020295_35870 [Streptomyces cinereospinus]
MVRRGGTHVVERQDREATLQFGGRLADDGLAVVVGEGQHADGFIELDGHAFHGQVEWHREVHGARLEDADGARDPVEGAVHDHRDHVLGARSRRDQGTRDAVGSFVELLVGPGPVAVGGSGGRRASPVPVAGTGRRR